MSLLEKLKKWFDSDEGKKEVDNYLNNLQKQERILNSQLERLYKSGRFFELTKKAVEKYNSNEYQDRWLSRGIEPPETLFWFLYEYAKKYGRECSKEEWDEYGNCFTTSLYNVDNVYLGRVDGLGSFIQVFIDKVHVA